MTTITTPAVRYHAFDALRGTMMLLGIALHAAVPYAAGAWFVHDGPRNVPITIFLVLVHVFRMPVFFAMSGFFGALLLERLGPRGFIRHRVKRVVVPLVVGWIVLAPLTVGVTGFVVAAHPSAMPAEALARTFTWADLFNPIHLWFLEYLALFSLTAVGVRTAARRVVPDATRGWVSGRLRLATGSIRGLLVLAMGTAVVYGLTGTLALPGPTSFIPRPRAFAVYGVYFAFGWWMFSSRDCLPAFRGLTARALGLAALFGVAHVLLLDAVFRTGGTRPLVNFCAVATNASMAWLSLAGFVGLFLEFADRPSPTWRYLSDSAYWLYLVHPPILVALQGLLMGVSLPPALKAGVVVAAACPVLFLTYHAGVRYTALGAWLNGPRLRSS